MHASTYWWHENCRGWGVDSPILSRLWTAFLNHSPWKWCIQLIVGWLTQPPDILIILVMSTWSQKDPHILSDADGIEMKEAPVFYRCPVDILKTIHHHVHIYINITLPSPCISQVQAFHSSRAHKLKLLKRRHMSNLVQI